MDHLEQYNALLKKYTNEQIIIAGVLSIMSALNCYENIYHKALMDEAIQRIK